ncbi:hypothetical protein C2845_PM07G09640 [Panicum miliaceum]|uniref:Uncharacterized protein n=1 Tax=Panicum miliaceum TaxID=4540 RepID=A0A3L6SKS6_PANMI|nr:hypothetical protein C2845_PM07G09640 [Panicum miliaceum]
MEELRRGSRAVRAGRRAFRSRGVRDLVRLLHQGPSPKPSSSTAAPAAPDKALLHNHGILNLQILQHGTLSILLNMGNNATPPGGFTNFIQPNVSQHFNFVGEPSPFAPFKPPQSTEDFQSEEEFSNPISSGDNTYVNVDSGDEAPRTKKQIFWTQEEVVRMDDNLYLLYLQMSSWLLNSTDSTIGADRKNDQYWTDVEAMYNETTLSQRKRNAKQIKDPFHKVNKWTDLFHSAWLKARMIYTGGYNDQMWIEKAYVVYIKDSEKFNLGPFVLMEVWNTVKTEAKWIAYNTGLKAARKRKSSGKEKEGEDSSHIDVDELDEQPIPMGQKAAKKQKYAKSKEVEHVDFEELDKFGKIQCEEHANRLKVLEVQQKLSYEKIEQVKLAHLAAKEQKEAAETQREARKCELETRMFDTYNRLLSMNVSLMSDEEKLDHANTMKYLKKRLFAEN